MRWKRVEGIANCLHVNTGGSQAWVGSFNDDYIAGLLPSTDTGQRRKLSYDVTLTAGSLTPPDFEVKDRIFYVPGNGAIHRWSMSTGVALSDWAGPSGKNFIGIAKADKFIYVKTATELYRVDTTQATPTFVRVTGTMPSNSSPMTIVNNRLYVPEDDASIKYLLLTGSATAGYTAVATSFTIQSIGTGHGLAGGVIIGMTSYSTFIYQSSNSASGTQGIAHGWDYTAGSGDLIGQANDISTVTVNARIAADTDGTLYVYDINQQKNLFAFYPTGAQTANVMNIDRTHSFPLGSRQASTYGFGYDQTNDRFFVPNVTRVNTYDKAVSSAHRSYQRFDLAGISGINNMSPRTLIVKGSIAYVFGWSSRAQDSNGLNVVNTYTWPDLRYITQTVVQNVGSSLGVLIGELAYFVNGHTLRPLALSSFTATGSAIINFQGQSGSINICYLDGTTIYIKSQNNSTVAAFSAAGTGSKTSITSMEIELIGSSLSANIMFADSEYFYFGRNINGNLGFDAYSKTTRLRDTNGDFQTTISALTNYSALFRDSILYVPATRHGRVYAFVKAV